MGHNAKINKEKLLKALENNLGIVTGCCKEAGISRITFYQYLKDDPEFRAAVDDINDIALDFAETQLLKKIKEGAERSIHFYLAKKGKSRGYGDKVDLNITNDKVKFKFNFGDIDNEIESDEDET